MRSAGIPIANICSEASNSPNKVAGSVWNTSNPILADGEIIIVQTTTQKKIKIGD